jgi:DNA-binding NarL/FixJ family response regulator
MTGTSNATSSGLRTLVVDDDEGFCWRATRLLRSAGLDARFHRGPFGTVHAVRQSASEVVLLDVNMPSLDGLALARLLRSTVSHARLVLCSNMKLVPLQRMATNLGLHGALSKESFDEGRMEEILAVLDTRPPSTRRSYDAVDTNGFRGVGGSRI